MKLFGAAAIAFQRGLASISPWFLVRALASASVRSLRADHILLLGSAPEPLLPEPIDKWTLWTVNASARHAAQLELGTPRVSVVDRGFFTEKGRSGALRQVETIDLGRVASVSTVRLMERPVCPAGCIRVSRFRRSIIVRAVTGSRTLDSGSFAALSTGGFAACLASLAAKNQVFLAGFTMGLDPGVKRTPHFYEDPNITASVRHDAPHQKTARKHSAADSAALSLISLRASNLSSREPDLVPRLSNWGDNPPAWARRRWV